MVDTTKPSNPELYDFLIANPTNDPRYDPLKYFSGFVCPEIWGYDDVKKSLLLMMMYDDDQVFGQRNRLHMLLAGEPGTAKSVFADWVIDNFHALYSDSNSTRVGLTANASGKHLTSGLLNKAHHSILVVDEIDQLEDRDSLREAMERGQYHIAKGKYDEDMEAMVRVIGCLNDIGRLSPALLERFDFTFTFDTPTLHASKMISKTLINNYFRGINVQNIAFLKGYIDYVSDFDPCLSDEEFDHAQNVFDGYFSSSKKGKSGRWISGVIRTAKAIARFNHRDVKSIDFFHGLCLKDKEFHRYLLSQVFKNGFSIKL